MQERVRTSIPYAPPPSSHQSRFRTSKALGSSFGRTGHRSPALLRIYLRIHFRERDDNEYKYGGRNAGKLSFPSLSTLLTSSTSLNSLHSYPFPSSSRTQSISPRIRSTSSTTVITHLYVFPTALSLLPLQPNSHLSTSVFVLFHCTHGTSLTVFVYFSVRLQLK